jgi:hypothetical protein
MRRAHDFSSVNTFCALRPHALQGKTHLSSIVRANCIRQYDDILPPGQKAQCSRFYRVLRGNTDQNEFVGSQFSEHSVGSRLLKRVKTAFFEYDLIVLSQYVRRNIGAITGSETCTAVAKCVPDFLLARCPGDTTIAQRISATSCLDSGNHRDVSKSSPGHQPSNIGEDPSVVSNASPTVREKEAPMSININDNPVRSLPDH